ncbi:calcium-binding protein CML45 [Carex littledalei]|uniref:Calcium-binding protein CML45 n=1 Tax=Carex littledalei TaxID=544730 RepID=A0A833QYP2_9POAL|nr:calcium-binding protein CML45 [Carex littledalei]
MEQIHYLNRLFCCLLSYLVRLAKYFARKKNSQFTQDSVKFSNRECDVYLHDNDVMTVMELLGLDTEHICNGALEGAHVLDLLQEKESSFDELKQAFAVFDMNGDGFITAVELMSVMGKLRLEEGMEIKDCERMIGAYDKDGDGKINFQDFRHLLENAS